MVVKILYWWKCEEERDSVLHQRMSSTTTKDHNVQSSNSLERMRQHLWKWSSTVDRCDVIMSIRVSGKPRLRSDVCIVYFCGKNKMSTNTKLKPYRVIIKPMMTSLLELQPTSRNLSAYQSQHEKQSKWSFWILFMLHYYYAFWLRYHWVRANYLVSHYLWIKHNQLHHKLRSNLCSEQLWCILKIIWSKVDICFMPCILPIYKCKDELTKK